MKQINIIDTQFSHGTSLGSGDIKIYPKYFSWDRSLTSGSKYTFITEDSFTKPRPEGYNYIAWLIEPISINKESYKYIRENHQNFSYVLSHNKEFLKSIPNGLYYPFGGCWIEEADRKIYPKTKLVSIIASDKIKSIGHKLRHEVIEKFAAAHNIDVFGRGYKEIPYKLEALKDYAYTIVIENEQSKGWFTEKLIDAFQTGCIPIYWGAPDIYDYFENTKGIFNIEFLEDFLNAEKKRPGSIMEHYNECLETTNKMLELSKKYTCTEDYLFLEYPNLFEVN